VLFFYYDDFSGISLVKNYGLNLVKEPLKMRSTLQETAQRLIPVLNETEKSEMLAYHVASVKYTKELQEVFIKDMSDHPVWGPLIKSIPKDISEAKNKISQELQHKAIVEGEWLPYIEYQIQEGITYAKMGLNFRMWYELISLARHYILPFLQLEYGKGTEFISALNGMNSLFDIGMSILGEAYIREKEEIIKEEQEKTKKLNEELEQKVLERTSALASINQELDSFSYSVSHDLRAPLRAMNGYAVMLKEDHGDKLDDDGRRIIQTIRDNAERMGRLIDDLLSFSRLGKTEIKRSMVDMDELTEGVLFDLKKTIPKNTRVKVNTLPKVSGDYNLMRQTMHNLISNAIKYSSKKSEPIIEINSEEKNGEIIFTVKDNGAGFDMQYADKLFGVFQRLHSQEEFDGTGVGLAIVHRIISKHKGKIWAEGKVDEGASFYFSLAAN
jgi:signal transduction histidine kinase